MPAKKGKKGKKGSKGGKGKKGKAKAKSSSAEDVPIGEMTDAQKLVQATSQIQSLQKLLALKTEQANKAIAAQNDLRAQLLAYHADFEKQQEDRFDVTSNMTRQYKSLQDELISHLNRVQTEAADLRDQLEVQKIDFDNTIKQKEAAIEQKDAEIAELKKQIDNMHVEFEEMLQETLAHMSQKLSSIPSAFDFALNE
ncbi:hypothetical protein P9112_009304 [Eukaryota sp. TZLM1-RC]